MIHEVVCMSFSSVSKAEDAKKAIQSKKETPLTILEKPTKWKLVTWRQVSDKDGVIFFLRGLPPQTEQTIFVGVEQAGKKANYEVLDGLSAAYHWLGEAVMDTVDVCGFTTGPKRYAARNMSKRELIRGTPLNGYVFGRRCQTLKELDEAVAEATTAGLFVSFLLLHGPDNSKTTTDVNEARQHLANS